MTRTKLRQWPLPASWAGGIVGPSPSQGWIVLPLPWIYLDPVYLPQINNLDPIRELLIRGRDLASLRGMKTATARPVRPSGIPSMIVPSAPRVPAFPSVPEGYVMVPKSMYDMLLASYQAKGHNSPREERVTSASTMGKPLRSHEQLVENRAVILHSLKDPMGMQELEKVTGLPRETLTIDLAVLRSSGKVGRRGSKKHGEYFLLG